MSDTIAEFVKTYCTTFFMNNSPNIFEGVSYKSFKKFKKMVTTRFELMNEFYAQKQDTVLAIISDCSATIFNNFQQ